jgi:hypothetical protein
LSGATSIKISLNSSIERIKIQTKQNLSIAYNLTLHRDA